MVSRCAAVGSAPPAVRRAAKRLRDARPTAVNLAWGVDRVLAAYTARGPDGCAGRSRMRSRPRTSQANRALGALGAELLPDGARVLTHCNAGALACVGYGTALGIVRAAAERGKRPHVWVDETRPVLQGARLTAWELDRLGIEHTLVADVAAGSLMASRRRRRRRRRRGPRRGERRRRQQDRHVPAGCSRGAPRDPVHRRGPDAPRSISRRPMVDDPCRAARRRRGDPLRRHPHCAPRRPVRTTPRSTSLPRALVTAIVTERGVARSPYTDSLQQLAARGIPVPSERPKG